MPGSIPSAARGLIVATLVLIALPSPADDDAERVRSRWQFHFEEHRIDLLVHRLSSTHRPETLAIENVRLLSMTSETVVPGRTVLVRDGRVVAIGTVGEVAVPAGARRIDGAERYLLPGLTDMHVHNLVSSSQHLLNLATGVTTVRDLDGFAWMLEVRQRVRDNLLLAPNMYVSGHILNARPMGMYATVVDSPEAAGPIVRRQAAAGYDFIKVHNSLPFETFKAIHQASDAEGLDVVGHIPHRVSVAEAIGRGQRTLEHFKGYIQDWDLEISPHDWVGATRGAEVFNCPTFYTYRQHLRGDEARRLVLDSDEMRYVPSRDKRAWLDLAAREPSVIHQSIRPKSESIFRALQPIGARFVAGTDSGGGYPFMVPGFALHEELRILEGLGLSPYEVLRTATVNAAEAMRREKDFGTIEVGKRADLLLVRDNPLEAVSHLSAIEAVVVRGIWLDRGDLDGILGEIEAIYDSPEATEASRPSAEDVRLFLEEMRQLQAEGWIFRGHDLDELATLSEALGIESGL